MEVLWEWPGMEVKVDTGGHILNANKIYIIVCLSKIICQFLL